MGFSNSMNSVFGLNDYVKQGFAEGEQKRKTNTLAQLAGDYASGGQPNYQAVAANGGDPMAYRKSEQERVGQFAAMLVNAPEAMRPQIYKQILPHLNALGLQAPPDYTPEIDGMAQQIAQQFGGGASAGVGVQSTYVDAQGNRVGIMRDGSTRILGQNAPNNQIMEANGGIFGVNKSDLTAAPVTIGQPAQQSPQGRSVQFDFAPGTSPEVQAATRQYAAADMGGQGQQLQPAPKAEKPGDSSRVLSPEEIKQYGLAPGTVAQVGSDGKVNVVQAAPKPTGPTDAMIRRNQSAADTAQATIDTIDQLIASPGYAELGTLAGDVKSNIPAIRTDAKDAQQQLDVLGGQIALSTMSSLKTLSSAGATGFGALNREELKLLQNAISSLQAGKLSHAQLDKNIGVVREKMQKIWQASIDATNGDSQGAIPAAKPANGGWSIQEVQ